MLALVPCPEELRSDVMGQAHLHKDVHEGFWLLSQDPSVISRAGNQAIIGESLQAIREKIDRDHNLPVGFTMTVPDTVYCYQWIEDRNNSYSYLPERDQQLRKEHIKLASKFLRKENDDRHWHILKLCSTPQTDRDMDEYRILVEARNHPKGVITTKFKLKDSGKVQVYKQDYVIERLSAEYHHVRVIYSPQRAKRLQTIRSRNMSKGLRKPERTCYDNIIDILKALRSVVRNEPCDWLYREMWSGRGIDICSRAAVHFYNLAVLLNRKARAQKAMAPFVKALWVHRKLLKRTGSDKFYCLWERELKRLGGPPKNPEKYMTRVRSNKDGVVELKAIKPDEGDKLA